MNMAGRAPRRIAVIGAGIVGVSTAIYLQRDGHGVTLIDRVGPAGGTSFGNAGGVVLGSCAPIAMPGILRDVPGMLLDRTGPLRIRWGYLRAIAPWLIAMVRASRPERVEEIAAALAAILNRCEAAWRDLVRGREVQSLLRPVGWLRAYTTDTGFAGTRATRDLMARHGMPFEVLNGDQVRQLEPALAPIFRHALFYSTSYQVTNPGRMIQDLAAAFAADGGRIETAEVHGFDLADGARRVLTSGHAIEADAIVLVAGAWSRHLAARLGARVRLDTERGYHLMLPPAEPGPRRPVVWGEKSFVLSPMEDGIRMTGGVEFAGLDAPADFTPIRRLLPLAKRMLPSLALEERSAWLGFRPSMPDSLPVIGRSPLARDVYLAFGHGHLGLTMGPATGRAIADLVAGRDPGFDLAPFRPER